MISIGRNRRVAPTSTLNLYASIGTHCDRERSRTVLASRLSRRAFGFVAIAALAACGQQNSLTPVSNAGAATAAANPAINLQSTPSSVSMGQSATLKRSESDAQSCTPSGGYADVHGHWRRCHQPAPTVTLAASPSTINSLGSSTLTWTASNSDACNASGGWQGQVATSGTWSTGTLSNTYGL